MIAYILRRTLYAIPILLGVNIIVFMLFFVISSPEDMARMHLGAKRVTPEQIDNWMREHSLHYPRFYNPGWRRVESLPADSKENNISFTSAGSGTYRILVESPASEKAAQERIVRLTSSHEDRLKLPDDFSSDGKRSLPAEPGLREYTFRIEPDGDSEEIPSLSVQFNVQEPSPKQRVIVEYLEDLSFLEHFTKTIFYQRSLKMIAFQYGKSEDGKDISEEIFRRIGPSLSITVPIFFIGLVINVFFAMIFAYLRGTYVDYWGVVLCVIGMSISALFYILAGQVVFGKILKLFPISGFDYQFPHTLKFLAMPIVVGVLSAAGGTIRFYRTVFLEEINKDYVRTARAKGLSESAVLFIHTLKNAMIPILTNLVVSLPFLFVGSLLLESFFGIPGMGSYMLDAIQSNDFSVVQALVSLGSFLYIIGLLMTDISYTLFDPRVRLGEGK